MPIHLKEDTKNQAMPGSSVSETRLKQLIVILQQQLNKLTSKIRQLKSEKSKLEYDLGRRDAEIRRLNAELQRVTRGRTRGGTDFGDF